METNQPGRAERPMFILSIFLGIFGLTAYASSKFIPGKAIVIITGLCLLGALITQAVHAIRMKRFWVAIRDLFLSLLASLAGMYILLCAFIILFQDAVANRTGSFFQPEPLSIETANSLAAPDLTSLDLVMPDGVHLRGWLLKNKTAERAPLIIYFNGSGGEVSKMLPHMRSLNGWSAALVDYRGFGLSDGVATQSNVLADALMIYDVMSKRTDIDAGRIVVMGYSLGTGVAVHLAANRSVAATVLVSPYDHWSLIGVNPSPIYKPLRGILKPYFNSLVLAPEIHTALLCLAGLNDTFVPPIFSRRLTDAWAGKVTMIEYPGEDHSLLFHPNSSWPDINKFLDDVRQP